MKPQLLFALLLSPLLFFSSCKDKQAQADALEEASDASRKLKEDLVKQLEENGSIEHDPAALDDIVAAAKKLEDSSTGDEAKSIKVMRIFMQSVQTDMTDLTKAQEAIITASDYSQVKAATDIDTLSEGVKNYQKLNAKLMAKVQSGWSTELNTNLDKEGVTQVIKSQTIQGFNNQMNPQKPHLIKIREADALICSALLKQHQILKNDFGKWEWNSSTGTPDFKDNTTVELYNEQAVKIQEAAAMQVKAQQQFFQVSR